MKCNICLLHPAVNSKITLESMFFITWCLMLPRRCLDSLEKPQKWSRQYYIIYYFKTTQWIEIHFFFALPRRQFQDYTEILVFVIRWCLMLPRRCLDSHKGPRSDRGNNTQFTISKPHKKLKFNICLLYPAVNSWSTLQSMFFFTWFLMLPRKCLDSLKGAQKWSWQ